MGGKSTSTTATRINNLAVQTSALGVTISRGWGRGRMKCNLIWYGAFRALSHTEKQGGKGGGAKSTTYTYTASVMMGICSGGPIRGVRTVYRDQDVYTDGATTALAQAGLSLALGGIGQTVWPYLTSNFPTQALGYSGLAYAYAQDYPLSDSASLSNHSFEVDFASQVGGGVVDADASVVVSDILSETPGWPSSLIAPLTEYQNYTLSVGLVLSPALEEQQTVVDLMTTIMQATNSEIFWSEGLVKVRPYGDAPASGNGHTFTPNLTPCYDLTEADFVPQSDGGPPVEKSIVDQTDAYNIVQFEFLDRANQYNTAIQPSQDLDNILEFGERRQDPTTVHVIADAGVAQIAADLYLGRTLYVRENYVFQLPWNFARLEQMDLVTLTTTTDRLQLSRQLVRIKKIEESDVGLLKFTSEGVDIGTATQASNTSHSGSGYSPNSAVAPGSVSPPLLLNAPLALSNGVPSVLIAAASTSASWGGCEVWVSVGGDYKMVGTIYSAARYGVTTTSLSQHADPDTAGTVGISISSGLGQMETGTQADADSASAPIMIGTEVMAYRDAALTGAEAYTLTYLRRGLYGTAPAGHASGEIFLRLDNAVFQYQYGNVSVGSTISVKLPSFNIYGLELEDISTVPVYTLVVGPPAPPTPGSGSWTATGGALTGGGSATPSIHVSGAADATAVSEILVEYRVSGTTDWTSMPTYPPTMTATDITNLAPSTSYDVGISYQQGGFTGGRLVIPSVMTGAPAVAGTASSTDVATNTTDISSILARLSTAGIP